MKLIAVMFIGVAATLIITHAVVPDRSPANPAVASTTLDIHVVLFAKADPTDPVVTTQLHNLAITVRVSTFDELNSTLASGDLLIIDADSFDDVPPDFLRSQVARGVPVIALNVPVRELYAKSDFAVLAADPHGRGPVDFGPLPRGGYPVPYFSYVHLGEGTAGGGQQELYDYYFRGNVRQLGLIARRL